MTSLISLLHPRLWAPKATALRAFSTTPAPAGKDSKHARKSMMKTVPKYPFPVRHTFKQSWFGLYDGKHIQFGNNIPDGEYSHKTRRTWKPNVKTKKLYSKALGKLVQVPIVTSVLRTIDKAGGLDEYLLSTKTARLASLGPYGWKLRHEIMKTPAIRKRFKEEKIELGLKGPLKGHKTTQVTPMA
ncbi:ribosomal L28 family-domain-containing protein [Terfezia claveryi]|nr:ribosomal L28 family-domain-containing protein [Terfezia claveryi]